MNSLAVNWRYRRETKATSARSETTAPQAIPAHRSEPHRHYDVGESRVGRGLDHPGTSVVTQAQLDFAVAGNHPQRITQIVAIESNGEVIALEVDLDRL